MQRKIIAQSAKITYSERGRDGAIDASRTISQQDVNYYSLYWDKLITPVSRVYCPVLPFEDQLLDLGILERPVLDYWETDGLPEALAKFQLELLYGYRLKEKETDWCLHSIGDSELYPIEVKSDMENVRISLFKSLPVPNESVHLADILEFKSRRRDELNQMHQYLDEIYFSVLKSPDDPLCESRAFINLSKAIDVLNGLSKENWRDEFRGYNFSFRFNSPKDVSIACLTALIPFAGEANNSSTALTIALAATSLIKVERKDEVILNSSDKTKNLQFIASAHDEGIFK